MLVPVGAQGLGRFGGLLVPPAVRGEDLDLLLRVGLNAPRTQRSLELSHVMPRCRSGAGERWNPKRYDPSPWFAFLVRIEVRDAGPVLVLVVAALDAPRYRVDRVWLLWGTCACALDATRSHHFHLLHFSATKVIVAPIVFPEGHRVEHPEGWEEVAAKGAVQAVGADVGSARGAPGSSPCRLDIVPADVRGLVDVAAREAVDPDGDPRVAITEVPKGCPLQGGTLRDETQCQRCSLFVLLIDALLGQRWGGGVLVTGALGGGLGCHDVNVGR